MPVPAGSVLPHIDGWHRPGGFGFLFPLMFFAFWIFAVRGLFCRPWGPWRSGVAMDGASARSTARDPHRRPATMCAWPT